eukprot:403342797
MEEEIQILLNNMKLLDIDLEQLQKTHRVPISSQMFAKSNPKGMALLVHSLLVQFNVEEYTSKFSICWFPYTMVELKEFKSIALEICQELILKGHLQPNIITKSVLETASGVKLWQALRNLSDYLMMFKLTQSGQLSKAEIKELPVFIQNALQLSENEESGLSSQYQSVMQSKMSGVNSDENFNPNLSKMTSASQIQTGIINKQGTNLEIIPQNCNSKMLKRNIRAAQVHTHQQMNEFTIKSQQIDQQQKQWIEFSLRLNDEYLKVKNETQNLKKQAHKLGLLSEDGFGFSELSKDLQSQGMACLDKIPQIQEIRQMTQNIIENDILARNNLESNVHSLLNDQSQINQSQTTPKSLVLDQNTLFSKVEENDEKEQLREHFKYSYSKDVLSVNRLMDHALEQITSFNDKSEKNSSKRIEGQRDFKDQLDWLIEQHKRNVDQLKETINVMQQ